MTALRRQMIEEFQIRHYTAGTQKSYLHFVARFAQHIGRSVGTEYRNMSLKYSAPDAPLEVTVWASG